MTFPRGSIGFRDIFKVLAGRRPGQLIVQYSDVCNAACPQCELRASNQFPRASLDRDALKRIVDAAAARGFTALSLTGGEPFLDPDTVIEILAYAARAGIPCTRTGTNGFFLRDPDKPGWEQRVRSIAERLAEANVYSFWISLDSADPAVHEAMRGLPGVVAGITRALPIFHEYGIYPAANLGINRNTGGRWIGAPSPGNGSCVPAGYTDRFHEAFDRFFRFVNLLGFTTANVCYPMSHAGMEAPDDTIVYRAASDDRVVTFDRAERAAIYRALGEVIPEWCGRIRIFTPLSSLARLRRSHETGEPDEYPCPGGSDYFYIDAHTGHAYPCGFRGAESLGPLDELDLFTLPKPSCRVCDWECFRDPAALLGPFGDLTRNPLRFLEYLTRYDTIARLWRRDIGYQRACRFFDGRLAPDYTRMARFVGVR